LEEKNRFSRIKLINEFCWQIHADAKKEQLNQSLMNSSPSHSPQPTSDDGWTMPTRAARNKLDKVDR
jgi:hypothetical protein